MIAKILEDNIKRSDKLKEWQSPPLIQYDYWDIRYEIPEKITDPIALISYIAEKYAKIKFSDLTQGDVLSFYFWIKDEMLNISETEMQHLTNRSKNKSRYVPSERAREFSALMELYQLAGKDIDMWEKFKKTKYEIVFEILLAMTIESEGTFKD